MSDDFKCPDRNCREDLIKSRMSKVGFFSTVGAIVAALGIVITVGYNSYSQGVKDRQEEISKNRTAVGEIGIIRQRMNTIDERQKEMKGQIDKIETSQQKVLQELIKMNAKLPDGRRRNTFSDDY